MQSQTKDGNRQQARLGLLRCISMLNKVFNTISRVNCKDSDSAAKWHFFKADVNPQNILLLRQNSDQRNEDSVVLINWKHCDFQDYEGADRTKQLDNFINIW